MPVFTRIRDDVLHVVVDGDYTSDELCRKGAEALESAEPSPIPVLLDMSGAAGLHRRSPEDLRDTSDFFAKRRALVTRVAIVAPNALAFGLMNMGSVYAESSGLEARPFSTKSEALEWLARRTP